MGKRIIHNSNNESNIDFPDMDLSNIKIPDMPQHQCDDVNHPSHYNKNGIEVIDCIEAWLGTQGAIDFCLGCCIKYLGRKNYKGSGLKDLKKTKWYLEWVINKLESNKLELNEDDDPDWN